MNKQTIKDLIEWLKGKDKSLTLEEVEHIIFVLEREIK